MKPCPFCAEPIQDAAVKCRYCGSVLVADAPSEEGAAAGDRPARPDQSWLWVGLAAVGLLALVGGGLLLVRSLDSPPPERPVVTVPRAPVPYQFMGIAWGSPVNEVRAQLASRGFRFTEQDDEGDHVFQGRLDGRDAVVIAMLSRGALAKTIVVLVSRDATEEAFAQATDRLTAEYGPPDVSTAASPRPVARWPVQGDATSGSRLWAAVTDEGDVAIHYESHLWVDEADRRRGEHG